MHVGGKTRGFWKPGAAGEFAVVIDNAMVFAGSLWPLTEPTPLMGRLALQELAAVVVRKFSHMSCRIFRCEKSGVKGKRGRAVPSPSVALLPDDSGGCLGHQDRRSASNLISGLHGDKWTVPLYEMAW